jgi:hypothetical protein
VQSQESDDDDDYDDESYSGYGQNELTLFKTL